MTNDTGVEDRAFLATDVPPGSEAQYAALMKLPMPELKRMLKDIDLPACGSKTQQVVRLIRQLAGLPQSAADEKLIAEVAEREAKFTKASTGLKGSKRGKGRGGVQPAAAPEPAPAAAAPAEEAALPALDEAEAEDLAAMMKEVEAVAAGAQAAAAAEQAAAAAPPPQKEKRDPKEKKQMRERSPQQAGGENKKIKIVVHSKVAKQAEEEKNKVEEAEDDDDEDLAMKGEGEPGAVVFGLGEGDADLLMADEGKWLRCVKEVVDAELEISLPPEEPEEGASKQEEAAGGAAGDAKAPPYLLRFVCPNGQSECAGVYALVPEETANGLPLWKMRQENRWLYSGSDGTWLVGSSKQKAQGFACRTGYLHLRQPHGGVLPHLIKGAVWRRVDGKQWREDADIVVSKYVPIPDHRRTGAPVRVDGLRRQPLRRLNGAFGRVLRREGDDCDIDAVCRVRLAEGREEDFEASNLQLRELESEHGEAWVRPRGDGPGEKAVLKKAMGAVLRLAREVASETSEGQIAKVPEELASSCSQVRVPEEASEGVAAAVGKAEKDLQVACFWKYQEDDAPDEDLVAGAACMATYEGSRCACRLKQVHAPTEKAIVKWDYDGTESEVPLGDVRPKLDKAGKERRQRRQWLRSAWELVILGGPRQRQLAAVRVLASIEDCCPGLWTKDLNDALAEARRGAAAAAPPGAAAPAVGVEVWPLRGGDAEPWLSGPAEAGRLKLTALRRASNAADCGMEFLLPAGLFLVGSTSERSRALDYLRWTLAEGGSSTASGSSERALRGDVAVLKTVRGRSVWLEPSVLRGIERETKTLIILEHGAEKKEEGTSEPSKLGKGEVAKEGNRGEAEWNPEGAAEVHVCGQDAELRARAAGQVEGLLQALALDDQPQDDVAAPWKKRKKGDPEASKQLEKQLEEERQRREDLERKLKEAEEQKEKLKASPPDFETRPSDPIIELRKLKYWPKDNQTWLSLQDTIWAHHPKLARGWIRVWSRTKDMEYYVRLTDGKSSLNYSDAREI